MSYNNAYGINEDGKLAVRVIGSGGGGQTIRNQDKTITENGTYTADSGYTGLGMVTVNVPIPTYYIEKTVDANGVLQNSPNFINLDGVSGLSDYVLAYAYSGMTMNSVNLSMLTNLNGAHCLEGAFEGTTVNSVDLSGVETITGLNACAYMCRNSTISNVPFGENLQTINGNSCCINTFTSCSNLDRTGMVGLKTIAAQSACASMFLNSGVSKTDLNSLETINGSRACQQMFGNTPNLKDIGLEKLVSITGDYAASSMFSNSGVEYVRFRSLENIAGDGDYMFQVCRQLKEAKYDMLNQISQYGMQNTFANCTALERVYFYNIKSDIGINAAGFTNMLLGCSNVTVRFPMVAQSSIGAWASVTGGFGGTNTTVLFDIVTTITGADGNTYTRQEKDSIATATAWVYNNTLYYTAGTNEPAVDGTIYSDAECTQSITTITAIA